MDKEHQEIIIAIIAGTITLLTIGAFMIFALSAFYRRRNRHLVETQQLQSQFQQTLLQTQLEIQEQTLHNISQEIHDNIGQVLSLTKLNLNTIDLQQPAAAQQKLDDSRKLVSKAIQDLRDLSKSLNSDYVTDLGLLRAIEYELELVAKTGVLQTQLDVTGTPVRLETQKELILFRIVQEAINNMLKHAEASLLTITVSYTATAFHINISDNGKGFDNTTPATDNKKTGLGLRNMYNRSRLIGAAASITSAPGTGTTVAISLSY